MLEIIHWITCITCYNSFPYFSLLLQEECTNTSDLLLGVTTRTTDVHRNSQGPNKGHHGKKELSFQEDLCSAIGNMP